VLHATRLATIRPPIVNRQAIDRLFKGLERFVNTGDSLEEYKALSKAWPDFWPLSLTDENTLSFEWEDICQPLFLAFRDTLRRVWLSDPFATQDSSVGFLLGIEGDFGSVIRGVIVTLPALNDIWRDFRAVYPTARVDFRAKVWPDWISGDFSYVAVSGFQCAMYWLFRESWRAKMCRRCSTYFIAQKPAQLYCSSECSNASHRAAALKWWNARGAARRTAQRRRKKGK
jgi:hypothetical protein